MKKFSLSLLWDCNENCLFCAKGRPPAGVRGRLSLGEAGKLILDKRREGCDSLSLDGGEPTLLAYLPEIIRTALAAGYKEIQVLTNAVELADRRKVEAIKKAHPRAAESVGFCVSLHSHLAAVSEKLTRSRHTHARTLAGIRNIIKCGFTCDLYHVITAANYRALPAFSAFAVKELPGICTITFSYIYPAFHSLEEMRVYPRLTPAQPYFSAAVARLRKAGVTAALSNCGIIPLCLMGGNETLFFKTFIDNNIGTSSYDTQKSEMLPFFQETFTKQNKIKAPQCAACVLDGVCGGIWKFYAQLYGTAELKPYKRSYFRKLPRSARSARLDLAAGLRCPDQAASAKIRILELRYGGFAKIGFCGAKPGTPLLAEAEAFARSIGCSAPIASKAAVLSPRNRGRALPRRS